MKEGLLSSSLNPWSRPGTRIIPIPVKRFPFNSRTMVFFLSTWTLTTFGWFVEWVTRKTYEVKLIIDLRLQRVNFYREINREMCNWVLVDTKEESFYSFWYYVIPWTHSTVKLRICLMVIFTVQEGHSNDCVPRNCGYDLIRRFSSRWRVSRFHFVPTQSVKRLSLTIENTRTHTHTHSRKYKGWGRYKER